MTHFINYNKTIEEILNLNIIEVIERELGINVPNKRTPQINCPFHDDKNPSFTIYRSTNTFYCFGCYKGGNVISFIKTLHGFTPKEAIRYLKKNYLKEIDEIEEKTEKKPKEGYYELVELTEELKNWLKQRKLNDKTIAKFGFVCFKDKDGRYWLGIPIFDENGKVVNCKIRRNPLKEEQSLPKYKWLKPEAEQTLFPLNCIDFEKDEIYLVEGELDAILLHQEGFNVITSTGGAGLKWKPEWIKMLKRFKTIYLIPDNDQAGLEWLNNLKNTFQFSLNDVKFIQLPEGIKDVTELYQSGKKLQDLLPLARSLEKKIFSLQEMLYKEKVELNDLSVFGKSDFFFEGLTHILAGYPKSGKTELIFRLAIDWAKEGKGVIYLSEEPEVIITLRAKKYISELENCDFPFFVIPSMGLNFEDLNDIFEEDFNILIVDTIRGIFGGMIDDEKDAAEISKFIIPLLKKTRETKKTLILVHHHTKSHQHPLKAVAGSHALAGFVDVVLTLETLEGNKRKLSSFGRIVESKSLIYEIKGGEFIVIDDPSLQEKEALKELILSFSEELSDWKSTAEIEELMKESSKNENLKLSRKKLLEVLNSLFNDGLIEREPKDSKPGTKYKWRIIDNNKEDQIENNDPELLYIPY